MGSGSTSERAVCSQEKLTNNLWLNLQVCLSSSSNSIVNPIYSSLEDFTIFHHFLSSHSQDFRTVIKERGTLTLEKVVQLAADWSSARKVYRRFSGFLALHLTAGIGEKLSKLLSTLGTMSPRFGLFSFFFYIRVGSYEENKRSKKPNILLLRKKKSNEEVNFCSKRCLKKKGLYRKFK